MIKRVIVVHGWGGTPEGGWRPWLKQQLEKKGFKVNLLAMPNSNKPQVKAWLDHLKAAVGTPDKDTILIGHSLGCPTILRYLETLKKNQKVGGAILVAGPAADSGFYPETSPFLKPFKWGTIRSHCNKFVAIYSDDDYWVPLQHGGILRFRLGAELIIKRGMKHFSGDDGCRKLPVLLNAVIELTKPKK